jgi:DNA-binding transcriptional LysR family regulator
VELTNAGRVLLDDGRRLLHLAEQAGDRALRAGEGTVGRLDLAIFGTGIFGAIPILLRAYRAETPDVKIVLHNMSKEEQLDALAHRTIDLAFNRVVQPLPGITSEALLAERLYVAVPEDHTLAARTAIRLGELEGEPLVLFPTGSRPSFIDVALECAAMRFEPSTQRWPTSARHRGASCGAAVAMPESGSTCACRRRLPAAHGEQRAAHRSVLHLSQRRHLPRAAPPARVVPRHRPFHRAAPLAVSRQDATGEGTGERTGERQPRGTTVQGL